jgi:hypothetical protein
MFVLVTYRGSSNMYVLLLVYCKMWGTMLLGYGKQPYLILFLSDRYMSDYRGIKASNGALYPKYSVFSVLLSSVSEHKNEILYSISQMLVGLCSVSAAVTL